MLESVKLLGCQFISNPRVGCDPALEGHAAGIELSR